jgi:hypothetical protein
MTIRKAVGAPIAMPADMPMPAHDAPRAGNATRAEIMSVTLLSIVLLAAGFALSLYIASR